jgi:hypothetical protein
MPWRCTCSDHQAAVRTANAERPKQVPSNNGRVEGIPITASAGSGPELDWARLGRTQLKRSAGKARFDSQIRLGRLAKNWEEKKT